MPDAVIFSGSDVLLGIGILGFYGYQFKIERAARKRSGELREILRSLVVEVNCLKALHFKRHPEDKALFDEVCKEEPTKETPT
jgi:hypothetical protein